MSNSVQPHIRQSTSSPVPGILQARVLEEGAIAFSIVEKTLWLVWRVLNHSDILKSIILTHFINVEQISRMYQPLLSHKYARE